MSHSCVENYLHVIFSTKLRKALIPLEAETALHSYIAGICKKNEVFVLKINGTQDHIHILLKLNPKVALSKILKEIKAYSSIWLKKKGYAEFSWQEGYGAYSCSYGHVKNVVEYIHNQKEHHQKVSFEEITKLNAKWGTKWLVESFENKFSVNNSRVRACEDD